jgi:small subunit ribosomal protein S6
MSLYEATFIVRQDLSAPDVEAVANEFKEIVTTAGGKIVKEETWGLRGLAYKINKSKRGHYIHLRLDTPKEAINEITRKAGLNENVVRNLIIKVEEHDKADSKILTEDTDKKPYRPRSA